MWTPHGCLYGVLRSFVVGVICAVFCAMRSKLFSLPSNLLKDSLTPSGPEASAWFHSQE